MEYGKQILSRVDSREKPLPKLKKTHSIDASVYEEFVRKCGGRSVSAVIEEMMIRFNETTPEPKTKK